MSTNQRSTALYSHPFSRAYWRDAAAELKSTKMLVITALLIALRVALKPLAIPLGPQLSIQTAMLATALGAMIFGPVMAIPAAIISDTVGFMIYPTGDYFLPFVLTEIASTMAYALCLYRAKPTALRVTLSRFLICFLVNVVLQQVIFAWYYLYIGNPESAQKQIVGMMTVARLFKNLCFFPIESVVLTLFLGLLMPAVQRANLVQTREHELKFKPKQMIALVCLLVVGVVSSVSYLDYYYKNNSVTKDYTYEQCIEMNKAMKTALLEQSDDWDKANVLTVIEYAEKPFFGKTTTYTVAVYTAQEGFELTEKMWAYKKTPASKDKNLQREATVYIVLDNDSMQVQEFHRKEE